MQTIKLIIYIIFIFILSTRHFVFRKSMKRCHFYTRQLIRTLTENGTHLLQ